MTSLSKKVGIVAFMGIGVFTVCAFLPKWQGLDPEADALKRLNADCRAYRSTPLHENAEVCRTYDQYAPHSTHWIRSLDAQIALARVAAASGEKHAAEVALRGALAPLPRLDEDGSFLSALVGSSAINRTLTVLDEHPSLDRSYVLHDVGFELLHHPLEGYGLQRRWQAAHAENLGQGEIASNLDASDQAAREMERAAFRFDEAACSVAAGKDNTAMCARLVTLARTSARLDAMRR